MNFRCIFVFSLSVQAASPWSRALCKLLEESHMRNNSFVKSLKERMAIGSNELHLLEKLRETAAGRKDASIFLRGYRKSKLDKHRLKRFQEFHKNRFGWLT